MIMSNSSGIFLDERTRSFYKLVFGAPVCRLFNCSYSFLLPLPSVWD